MTFKVLLAATLAFAISAPGLAGDKAEQKDEKQTERKEKKICRTETVTGSLVAKRRICMTQAQWDELSSSTKKGLDDTYRNAAGGANPSFNPGPAG
jgi:hypothetical protein